MKKLVKEDECVSNRVYLQSNTDRYGTCVCLFLCRLSLKDKLLLRAETCVTREGDSIQV